MSSRRTLSAAVLADLDYARSSVQRPAPIMRALPERAVQFGTGAFLRGFVDAFIDDSNRRGEFNGRVVAVGSTGSGRDRAFADQDGLYTLVIAGRRGDALVDERRIVGSVSRALAASSQWSDVLTVARNPSIRLVFSNTTEAGIALDARDTTIAGSDVQAPHSYPAKLARFLLERARAFDYDARRGLVVLPCELLDDNGPKLEALVREQVQRWVNAHAAVDERGAMTDFRHDAFTQWLNDAVIFCNTLVDRIVPGTPDASEHEQMQRDVGYDDALLTMAEPYALFAIEGDSALAERLGLTDGAGAIQVVPDVRPYRERKVRLLNGTHTAMAALGLLADVSTVFEAMSTPPLFALLQQLAKRDIAPVLDVPEAESFADTVLERFANPQVRHRLTDIASQGTLKWRVRLLPVLRRYASADEAIPSSLVMALAAQLYLAHPEARARRDALGVAPFADDLGALVQAHWGRHDAHDVAAFESVVQDVLADRAIWDDDLRDVRGLASSLTDMLQRLHSAGVQTLLSPALVTS